MIAWSYRVTTLCCQRRPLKKTGARGGGAVLRDVVRRYMTARLVAGNADPGARFTGRDAYLLLDQTGQIRNLRPL
jgi:hypothetical protein